ncbi:phage tail protein [Photorhabdus luminescens]|uniref:Phage tail protein C-terminal domain-containing protein n=1 Tax=Photorhabdus luminescens subsp. mexicana TaxID=2100167 RepID=A0A4R4JQ90_PHOLU|nr:phage tail protein [Photorhabdus luminescens]TDB56176.1 hypothetical protein C5468_00290 [Photorhabdus luminescens subsp. mexicana]
MNYKNDFKAFSTNNNANVVSQEGYEESRSLKMGFPPDDITVHLLNKVLRQSSTITSVLANFIATYSGNDVLDDGNLVKLATQLSRALEQKIAAEVPNASLTQKGVTQLTDKTGNSNTLAVTQKLVSDVNDNANNRLAKNQNGADIPDKNAFVKNLGLSETVEQARNAFQKSGGDVNGDVSVNGTLTSRGHIRVSHPQGFAGIDFIDDRNSNYLVLEANNGNGAYFVQRNAKSENQWQLMFPAKTGMLATIDDVIHTNGGVVGKNSYSTIDDFDKVPPNSTFFGYSEGLNGAGITGPGIKLSGGAFRGYDLMIQAAYYAGNSGLCFRSRNGDGAGRWNPWYSIWSTSNAKPDTNGFLKQSSPIVEIYPDGTFKTNDESKEATVERLSEGVYLITGVLGFNADAAWGGGDGGIEIPLCKNKLPLIWVDYEVMQDGSIKLMTYHREHPDAPAFARNVREGYTDGNLIDIPQGRFISVRVQMPAIPDKLPTV